MISKDDLYSCKLFLNSVIPLVKVIVEDDEKLAHKFYGKTAKIQISVLNEDKKMGTCFEITDGIWTVVKGIAENPEVELEFKSVLEFNGFFKGKSKKLPKIRGLMHLGLVIGIFTALLKMAKLLGATDIPTEEETKRLLTKLFFYLLSSGISQLNKQGHPAISNWVKKSPDRVYSWEVTGSPELSAYIRIKAGNSKASRGVYKRSKPFFNMKFDSVDSALGILMEKDNLIQATIAGRLSMEGAPEFGAQIGEYMFTVGNYVK